MLVLLGLHVIHHNGQLLLAVLGGPPVDPHHAAKTWAPARRRAKARNATPRDCSDYRLLRCGGRRRGHYAQQVSGGS